MYLTQGGDREQLAGTLGAVILQDAQQQDHQNIRNTHDASAFYVWNERLQKMGYTTVSGRISRKYFQEQFYGLTEKEVM